jgi:poly-beta-1,6-N-acetyl-D-glucosamine synthase
MIVDDDPDRAGAPMNGQRNDAYVIVTAARNEASFIGRTIQSVVSQSVQPRKWIVISDGSTDATDEIVREACAAFPFIELVRSDQNQARNFASKVYAVNEGARRVKELDYRFISHLDADVSFEPSYFASLIAKFDADPKLGVAGGSIFEWNGNGFRARTLNRKHSVAGAVQMFRRDCYEALGGLRPMKYGGEDWCAEVSALMNGWHVESFADLRVIHHRPTGAVDGALRRAYRSGYMDFSLGTHPLFEVVKLAGRLGGVPPVVGALSRLLGFVAASVRQEERLVSDDFVAFLRRDQLERLRRAALEVLSGREVSKQSH